MINKIKPFVKWVGGKGMILDKIVSRFPNDVEIYVEPFVGGGSVFMNYISNYSVLKTIVINDVNEDLINCYRVIKNNHEELLKLLDSLQVKYNSLTEEKQKEMYYEIRERYNEHVSDSITQSAYFIFLNKLNFNGLYRLNRKGVYNAAFGYRKIASLYENDSIVELSKVLKNITILCGDYSETLNYSNNEKTFFYFDPPYIPINDDVKNKFYNSKDFYKNDYLRLKNFCDDITKNGAKFIMSNSTRKDGFLENLYSDYNFDYIQAPRKISGKASSRMSVKECLISNFKN